MPRIRTLKPEFWQDEKLAPLAPIDRLVFIGLISMADDAGRLVDNTKIIDGFLFLETDDSSRISLDRLSDLGRIQRYTSPSGQKLIQITNWSRHQVVDNPSSYTLPGPRGEVGYRRTVTKARKSQRQGARPSRKPRETVESSSPSDLRSTSVDLRSSILDHQSASVDLGSGESYDARSPVASHENGKSNGDARSPASSTSTQFGPSAIALLDRFFPGEAVRAAKAKELAATLTPEGAPFDGDDRAHAVDVTHLDAACTAVLAMAPRLRKPGSVLRLVFLKLRDTYQERRAAIEKVALGVANGQRGGRAKRIGEVLVPIQDERDAALAERQEALQWAAEHESAAELINQRLQREWKGINPKTDAFKSMLVSELVEAMRAERRAAKESPPTAQKRSRTAAAAAGGA
jgi:hypothetical protein